MDKQKELENLRGEIEDLNQKLKEKSDAIYMSTDYDNYVECENDGEKETKFPELFAVEKEIRELDNKMDALVQREEELEQLIQHEEEINKAKERCVEIDAEVEGLEKEIESTAQEYANIRSETLRLTKEISVLKKSEEYKKGDEATLKKVNELESELEKKIKIRSVLGSRLKKTRKEIKNLQEEKQKLVEKYGEEILPQTAAQQTTAPQAAAQQTAAPQTEAQQTTAQQTTAPQTEAQQTTAQQTTAPQAEAQQTTAQQTAAQQTAAQQTAAQQTAAQQTAAPQAIENKRQLKDMFRRVKQGKISNYDFMLLSEMLKDPNKYDELGITTGPIFNKSKVMLKAMANFLAQKEKTARIFREKFGIKSDLASEEVQYVPDSNLRNWKSVNSLIENQDIRTASEEVFRTIAAKDANDIPPELADSYKEAVCEARCFEGFRAALKTYGEVSKARTLKKYSWLLEEKNKAVQPLGSASGETPITPENSDMHNSLAGKVQEEADYTGISTHHSSPEDKVK